MIITHVLSMKSRLCLLLSHVITFVDIKYVLSSYTLVHNNMVTPVSPFIEMMQEVLVPYNICQVNKCVNTFGR